MTKKPLQISFSQEERKKNKQICKILGEKTESKMIKKVITLFFEKLFGK